MATAPRTEQKALALDVGRLDATEGRRHRSDRRFRVALAVIVVVGAVLRAGPLMAGLPYSSYWDEYGIVEPASHQLAQGTWDPGWYWYPSLMTNITSAIGAVLHVVGVDGIRDAAVATDRSPYLEVLPAGLVLVARAVTLVSSVATVAVVGVLGARLGGRRVGLVAAALAAVLPALVTRAPIAVTDTPAAFFVAVVGYAAVRLGDTARPRRWAAVAGAGTGLALVTKYPSVLVGVVVVVAVAALVDRSWVERGRLFAIAAVAGGVAAVVGMPALVLRPRAVLLDLGHLSAFYDSRPPSRSYLQQATDSAEVGVILLVLAAVGMAVLLVGARTRAVAGGHLAFAIVLVAVLERSDYQHIRNLLPLLPFACVAAAVGVVRSVDRLVARWRPSSTVTAVLALLVLSPLLWTWADGPIRESITSRRDLVDSRVEARRLAADVVGPDDEVLVAEELALLAQRLDALGADVTVQSQTEPIADPHRFDVVMLGRLGQAPWAWMLEVADRPRLGSVGSLLISCEVGDDNPACPPGGGNASRTWHNNRVRVVVLGPPG